jgi:hypothetical protein
VSAVAWLDAHGDGVPPALAARMRTLVGGDAAATARVEVAGDSAVAGTRADNAAALISAGTHALRGVLAAAPMTRAHALDLLAADALVTFAFESGADDAERFGERAVAAMQQIAALAS